MQASDLVDIFVGSASSADAGPGEKQSQVEELLGSQVLILVCSVCVAIGTFPHLLASSMLVLLRLPWPLIEALQADAPPVECR